MIEKLTDYCPILKDNCSIKVEYEYSPTMDRGDTYIKKLPITSCPIYSTECPLYKRLPQNK